MGKTGGPGWSACMDGWSNQTEGCVVHGCAAGERINTVTNPNWNIGRSPILSTYIYI